MEPNKVETPAVEPPKAEVKDEVQYSDTEKAALEQGWRPKGEWDGPEDEWVPAKAFMKFGEVQHSLKQAKQESSQKEKVIKAMKEFHLKVKEDAKKEVLDTLRRQKKEAIKGEDYQRVAELDLQLDELQSNLDTKFKAADEQLQRVEAANTPPHPDYLEWSRRNPWYIPGATTGITVDADSIGIGYAQRNPGATPIEVLEYVEDKIKKLYPESFKNPERSKPAAVDDGAGERASPDSSNTKRRPKLTEAEKQAAEQFGLTHEEYAEGLKKWDAQKGVV